MSKVWTKSNNKLYLKDITSSIDKLENRVYTVEWDNKIGELYLKDIFKSFEFDFKLYGLEDDFIARVLKTYKLTKASLGILLNGIKGTGKTITAQTICNELNLPIIIIGQNYVGLDSFLIDITQEVVIFVDEYEKIFRGTISDEDYDYKPEQGQGTLLSIMDGAYKTENRKIFILTTNSASINNSMLNRPGRLRYRKEFGDLSLDSVTQIIDDTITNEEFKKDIMSFIRPLKIITVDIIKSIVSEVNIHNESPYDCCKDFNLEFKDTEYDIMQLFNDKEPELLFAKRKEVELSTVMDETRPWNNNGFYVGNMYFKIISKPDFHKLIFNVTKMNAGGDSITIQFKKIERTHQIFANYNM